MRPISITILACLTLITTFTACNSNQKFTKEKWNEGNGISYSLRDKVLEDLLATHQLKGMNYKDVIRLLGKPDDTAALKTSYEIINTQSQYNPKKEPIYKKNLEFYFGKDSLVTRTAIYEHTNDKY